MWVTKLMISQVKKRIFAQKRPNLAQNWHFWSIWARPCRLIRCPVSGSVGGCGTRAVSRKTPIYFMILLYFSDDKINCDYVPEDIFRAFSTLDFKETFINWFVVI